MAVRNGLGEKVSESCGNSSSSIAACSVGDADRPPRALGVAASRVTRPRRRRRRRPLRPVDDPVCGGVGADADRSGVTAFRSVPGSATPRYPGTGDVAATTTSLPADRRGGVTSDSGGIAVANTDPAEPCV